jgi:hypothetical protein
VKIDKGGGTPIFVSSRKHDGGCTLIQGTCRLRLRPCEMQALIGALQEMMTQGQRESQNASNNI